MFSASKLLSTSRQLLRGNSILSKKLGESSRGYHVVSAPAKKKVPSAELYAMGLVLFLSIWSFPFWVVYHIPDYQKEDRNTYTGK